MFRARLCAAHMGGFLSQERVFTTSSLGPFVILGRRRKGNNMKKALGTRLEHLKKGSFFGESSLTLSSL